MGIYGAFHYASGMAGRGLHIMAAGLRSAAKWQRCSFSRRALLLGFIGSSNRLAGAKLALDSFSVVG